MALASEGDEFDQSTGMFCPTDESQITVLVFLTSKALHSVFADANVRLIFYLATRQSVQRLLKEPVVFSYE